MRQKAILGLLSILVMAPLVSGQTTVEQIWGEGEVGELQRWRIEEFNENNGASSIFTNNATWLDFNPYPKAIDTSILFVEIRFTLTVQTTDDGDWNYTFETSTPTTWQGCSWIVPTRDPGVLGGSPVTYATFSISCAATIDSLAEDEQFQWWINRTIESGTPDVPIAQHLSVRMDRGDFIVTSQPTSFETATGVTGIEFTAFILLIGLAILVWSRSTDYVMQSLVATLTIGLGAIGLMLYQESIIWIPLGSILILTGAYMFLRPTLEGIGGGTNG